ncbi:MAG TPA: YicC/YloC family endoribonuclease [Fibrobacteria bacterium]|nr:YicC/YloC family endoribonuclease [Fibrobacteria bacterium]
MPLKSMTGYGRAEFSDDAHVISVEIKSVNNRYLDFQCRGPRELLNLDTVLRKELGDFVTRGSVTCSVNVEVLGEPAQSAGVALNDALLEAYIALAKRMADALGGPAPTAAELVPALWRVPGMVSHEAPEAQGAAKVKAAAEAAAALQTKIIPVFRAAAADLVTMREREGGELARDFETRIRAFHPALDKVAELLPARNREYAAKLRERVRELLDGAVIAEDRLATEIGIMAEKLDVAEEMTRLRAHLDHFLEILATHPAPGKKLGFLQQEMLREVNTLSNKSQQYDIQQTCIGWKEDLEIIREQIANVE